MQNYAYYWVLIIDVIMCEQLPGTYFILICKVVQEKYNSLWNVVKSQVTRHGNAQVKYLKIVSGVLK